MFGPPHCSHPHFQQWVNDSTNPSGWKTMISFDLDQAFTTCRLICHRTRVQPEQRQWVTNIVTAKSALTVVRLQQTVTPHFWNLYCNTALLLKPCLTHCSAVDPCYIKRQEGYALHVIPRTCKFSLFGKHPSGIVTLWIWDFVMPLSGHMATTCTHRTGKEWQTSALRRSNRRGKPYHSRICYYHAVSIWW